MFTKESEIEEYLRVETEKLGGKALKFVSPGWKGCPDRMLLLPGGRVVFVETKKPGLKGSALQMYRQEELRKLGFVALDVDTKVKALLLLSSIEKLCRKGREDR